MTDSKKRLPMNAGLVEAALRRHVDHHANTLIPEAEIMWGYAGKRGIYRADFISISRAGYGTEFEVKVSLADWRRDLAKPKLDSMPAWVSRFIYVVPEDLGIPDWAPVWSGVWHVRPLIVTLDKHTDEERRGADGYEIVAARQPKVRGTEKVPVGVVAKWMGNFYYRYWNQRIHAEQRIARHIREGVA